jgi:hypothetical protein
MTAGRAMCYLAQLTLHGHGVFIHAIKDRLNELTRVITHNARSMRNHRAISEQHATCNSKSNKGLSDIHSPPVYLLCSMQENR